MILPDKNTPYEKSIIYYSDLILEMLYTIKDEKNIETIWYIFHKKYEDINFASFYDSVMLLFMLNLIKLNEKEELEIIQKNKNS